MDNGQNFFPFNGQLPNMNMKDINGLMQQLSQLMEGGLMQSLQRLGQMQNTIPHVPGFPIMPLQPHARSGGQAGKQAGAPSGGQSGTASGGPSGAQGAVPPMGSPYSMLQLQEMMERLNHFLSNDLMRYMYNLQAHNPNFTTMPSRDTPKPAEVTKQMPIQLWETEQHMYVLASIPGQKSSDDVKVTFVSDRLLRLRAKGPTSRPERNSRIVATEFPRGIIERDVELPHAVKTKTYSAQYSDGLYTLTLHKLDEDVEISIFDE